MGQPAPVVFAPARAKTDQEPPPLIGALFTEDPTRHIPLRQAPEPLPRRTPAVVLWSLRGLILLVAAAGAAVAFAGQKSATVDVDGTVRSIRTYATDPVEVLERSGVRLAPNDLIRVGGERVALRRDGRPVPPPTLRDGQRITYRSAKRVEVVVDERRYDVVTYGLTVREGLKALGMNPGERDHVSPSLSSELEPGMTLNVRNAIHTTVRVDGSLRDIVSGGETVDELLDAAGIDVGSRDYVIPSRSAEPEDGMWIRVVRVRHVITESRVSVPFEVVTRSDASLESGVRRVIQSGEEGLKVKQVRSVLEDGVRVSTSVLSERTLRAPKNHIVRVGTKAPSFSGGGSSQKGIASWYGADGLVAAHRTLPMGTVVRVTNLDNGKSVNVRIADRGPFVEGRVIDLSDDAYERVGALSDGTFNAKIDW